MQPMLRTTYHASESPVGLVKTQIAETHPRASHPEGVGWGPKICISDNFIGDPDVAGPMTRPL